jgi:uncharacterized OB-fold protein
LSTLPELTSENTAFWTGGARGELMIAFCDDCTAAIHPPQVICPVCMSRGVTPRAVAGTGTVYTFTVNHQQWLPDMKVPFAIAVVDVDGAAGVRVTAPVDCSNPAVVNIGQRMTIAFDRREDVWLPQWRPLGGEAA